MSNKLKCLKAFAILVMIIFLSACNKDTVFKVVECRQEMQVPVVTPEGVDHDEELLEKRIAEITKNRRENWSVYLNVPLTGFTLEINNRQVVAASEIKLFNMATLFNEMKNGDVAIDDKLELYLHKMITISSNDASNEVVKAIGGGDFFKGANLVTEFANKLGCTDTKEQHMLFDVATATSGRNVTSVKDCGQLLNKIYFKNCVSPELDEQMLELLKQQTRRAKIPAGVPNGVVVANKTGENSKVEFDAAIVFSPNCDYILCICATDLKGVDVYGTFNEISSTVYEFFNPEEI